MQKKREMDMCEGSLWSKILIFSIPLILTGILQLLFNAADIVVVGRFAGEESLAAVGSTTSFVNLTINFFIGISMGVNAIVARHFGNKNEAAIQESVHTSITMGLICGVFLTVAGQFITYPLLRLMQSPENVIDLSAVYLKVYFWGMPALMVYNFASAVLRALGDTKRPLLYLSLAGIINVVLNLIFVIVFHLDVLGVALATVISQYVSAVLVLLSLTKLEGPCQFFFQKMGITMQRLKEILGIGIPSGVQSLLFSISNVMFQTNVNAFGSTVMAGNSAAGNIEGFVYAGMSAYSQTAVSFVSQNYGAGKRERVKQAMMICVLLTTLVGIAEAIFCYIFDEALVGIYSTEPDVIAIGVERLHIIVSLYFLCGILDVLVASLRGLGYAFVTMLISVVGICGLRILWMSTVCVAFPEPLILYLSYPVTWIVTMIADIIYLSYLFRHKYTAGAVVAK